MIVPICKASFMDEVDDIINNDRHERKLRRKIRTSEDR